MVQQNWILLALVGAVLIYDASGLKCITCNAADADCIGGAATNSAECANGETSCFLRITGANIVRGCYQPTQGDDCPTDGVSSCISCETGDDCNSQPWLRCHQCTTEDVACTQAKLDVGTLCKTFKTANKCYQRFLEEKVERGCESDVLPGTEDVCQGNDQCERCEVNDCNKDAGSKFQATKCVQCKDGTDSCLDGSLPATNCAAPFNGKCYSRITADGVLERGCHNVLPQPETCTGPSCNICETGDGCNKGIFPANRLRCHQCQKSVADATCADDLTTEDTSKICKLYKEADKCYSRVKDDLSFDRGCQSDLPDTENSCNGLENCFECSISNCNTLSEQKLKDSTKCQRCNSDDAACLAGTAPVQSCGLADDVCFVRINNGKLERDCLSTLTDDAEKAKCNSESDNTCVACKEPGCNNQKWLQCHTCSGDACKPEQGGTGAFCTNYRESNKCYSRVKADLSFDRGCQSDLPDTEKSCNGLKNCFECSSNNCNTLSEQELKDSTKCQRCNSDDAACLAGTASVQSCGLANDVCFVRINDGKLERDCLSTLTDDAEKVKCNSASDNTCVACKEPECNNQKWLQCHTCSGDACKPEQGGTGAFCKNYRESNKCYERFLDGTEVQRGCESDLEPTTENVCAGNQQCRTCSDPNGCNKDVSTVFQETKCVQCKSGEDDADKSCLKGIKAETVCLNPDGMCYSRIIDGGILDKGCRSALTTQCTGDLCQLCSAAECNKGVYPESRLSCYQCSKGNDASCSAEMTGDAKSEICTIYKSDNKCFTRVTATRFERGCQSDVDGDVCNGQDNCLECNGKNCNSLSEEKLKNVAKCVKCTSDDLGCMDASAASAVNCDNVEDSCFVRVDSGKLERDCLLKLSATDQAKCNDANDQSCVTCTGQGCNVQKWIKCHQCKETSSATCSGAQQDADAQFCPKYKADNECYERLESEKVVRGCANDLSEAACTNNLECKTCSESACNKAAASALQTNQRCLQCSTTSDAGGLCLAGTTASQPCKKESEGKCFNQIQPDGHLKRGCQGDLTTAEITACTGETCKICNTKECNTGLFPANRLKCYQCKSTVDESCLNELQDADKSGYCKLFVAQDKCYSRDADDIFERGCQSDLGLTADACKDLDAKHCESCEKPDCNTISKTKLNGAGAITLNVVLVVVAALAVISGL